MKKIFFILFLVTNISFSSPVYILKAEDVDDKIEIYVNDSLVYSFNRSGWLPEQCNTEFDLTYFLDNETNYIRFVVYEFGKYRWNANLKLYENNNIIWQDSESDAVKDGDFGVKYDKTIILNK